MFEKVKSNQYVREQLKDDVIGLLATIGFILLIGVPVTLLIFHSLIFY